ncbi:tripartite tricarboxylate transporter substrate binding protein [Acidovorax sp. A79]|uniref:Bug family tripartite tricarboxylate transporter substrate binding protein n=1 Tax=Acidovorax sp. A79 TaxID=3056107 RepID=UPI0034E84354
MNLLPRLVGACAFVFAVVAQAQSAYPSQSIKVIVPFPPGGGTDAVTRMVLDKIRAGTGWTLIVENKAGAGGNIGMDAVAKAAPDGYTLGMGQTANLAINPSLYAKMPYDAAKAFAPIATIAGQAVVLVVKADSHYKTLKDLVNAAKIKPDSLTMASAGNGTVGHLTGEVFTKQVGIITRHIPYKGAGPATTDLLGGQVDYYFATPQTVISFVKAGKLRALAVSSAKRMPALPDVPTVAESGFAGFDTSDWKMLVAPAGTPPAIVSRLQAEVAKALSLPDTVATLIAEGSAPVGGTSQEAAALLKAEQQRVVRTRNIKLD